MTREALELAREATRRWPAMGSVEYTRKVMALTKAQKNLDDPTKRV